MVIINSDDFGADIEINKATSLAFAKGLISSTTTLMNYEGLEDAVSYIEKGLISPSSVGIHLNLTSGIPLTQEIKNNPIFCRDGFFVANKSVLASFVLDSYSRKCVFNELDAQINRFIEIFGFLPSHIDSHHHVHTKWAIAKCVIKVANKHKIDSIRLTKNTGSDFGFLKGVYKSLFNNYLRYRGFIVTEYFGPPNDLFRAGINPSKDYELMVHTKISENGLEILDQDSLNLEDKLKKVFKNEDWQLVNYQEFRNKRRPSHHGRNRIILKLPT